MNIILSLRRIASIYSTLLCLTLVSVIAQNGHEHSLDAIVDMNDELPETHLSQIAALQVKGALAKHAIPEPIPMPLTTAQQSKTAIFQETLYKFLASNYNRKDYAHELSQSCSDILYFLELSNEMNLGAGAGALVLRLANNKIKSAEVFDDSALLQFLDALPTLVENYFGDTETKPTNQFDLTFLKKHFETVLLRQLTDHLPLLQSKPALFIESLSSELSSYFAHEAEKIKRATRAQSDTERLRGMIIRILETMLSKTVWQPQDPETIWPSFAGIAHGLSILASENIVDNMDDLDDLFWSLTHRFCFFLDIAGGTLPFNIYEQIENDLAARSVFFLEFKEQDGGITTKKETLATALLHAKARAFAYEKKGIHS
jgi:hypothetical protein